jgi:hypothetical protein
VYLLTQDVMPLNLSINQGNRAEINISLTPASTHTTPERVSLYVLPDAQRFKGIFSKPLHTSSRRNGVQLKPLKITFD